MFIWIGLAVGLVIASVILHREIYHYDGAHLGPRAQGWLYSIWATKYDRDKHATQAGDAELLIGPLMKRLTGNQISTAEALVLDVATGTGRFPLALLREAGFAGRIIGLDIAHGMLERAAQKLAPYGERVVFVRHAAKPLPFPDNTFDVVSCVEALELMPEVEAVLAELARVLRPGGVLVTSRCTKAWGYEIKLRRAEEFAKILNTIGLEQVDILPWWEWFDRVLACKPGQLISAEQRTLTDVLCCSACGTAALTKLLPNTLHCRHCGADLPIGPEGIVLI